ncbi:unnamed protein product, partial [Coregonus sp. 'balchen']
AVGTADDPTAITTIQSAATFSSDQPIEYLFKTEGGRYVMLFSQSGGLEGEASETHYYYPVTDGTQTTMVADVQAPETLLTQSTPTSQLYGMMSPKDVLGGANQRSIAPCTKILNT